VLRQEKEIIITIRQLARDSGKLVNVEISAQEAVYIVLQLPLRKASQQIVFINTSLPDEKVELKIETKE